MNIALCGMLVARNAACTFAGSVDPARLIASASTTKACADRPLTSPMSLPVLTLYTALTPAERLPGGPRLHTLRLTRPCAIAPTAGRNDGSEKPAESPMIIGGR